MSNNDTNREDKLKILERALDTFNRILERCWLCPRKCGVNRLNGEKGFCKSAKEIYISSFGPHFGEEKVLVGRFGSGTIFFTGCNLGCVYCQNYTISQLYEGYRISERELADIMLSLQQKGCHNINLVTPTHLVPQIMRALYYAIKEGLTVPLVFNCGGYESLSIIQMLKGIIDIYMPDIKYWESSASEQFSNAKDYPLIAKTAVKEMYNQVGDLLIDKEGVAYKGLLIRHLVLPNNLAGSKEILEFISTHISKYSFINIMDQYRPCFEAFKYPQLSRSITIEEYKRVIELAHSYGLKRGFL
ncbi:MAG: radical SAM protein [Candidatus Omnitrophica bacterium]|nr:radical SAM protein [Candidatus Omnitrophota bacterium]